MLDPLLPFQKSLYSALATPPIDYNGVLVPVTYFMPAEPVFPAVSVSQITATPASYIAACTSWSCTVLLTVITRFNSSGETSTIPASLITDEILRRVAGQQLPLSDGFSMLPIEVAQLSDVTEFKVYSDYLKYIRLRVRIQ